MELVCAFTKDVWNSMQGPIKRKLLAREHILVALWDGFTQEYGVGETALPEAAERKALRQTSLVFLRKMLFQETSVNQQTAGLTFQDMGRWLDLI